VLEIEELAKQFETVIKKRPEDTGFYGLSES
jgi:hypothetical protein